MEQIPKFKKSLQKKKPIFIVDDIYNYNFICYNNKEKAEKYKYKEYKTKYYCTAFITLQNDTIKNYNNKHTHRLNK